MKVFFVTFLFISYPSNFLTLTSFKDLSIKLPSSEIMRATFLQRFSNTSKNITITSLESFFKNQGVQLLASLAHPTNKYERGEFSISDNQILVNIYYKNYTTKLHIKKTLGLFTSIEVVSDDDYIKPFTAVEATKNIILRLLKSEKSKKRKTEFEKQTNKLFKDMDGCDLACLALTLNYWND